MLNRIIPLWILLLCFLSWVLLTVAFGWVVKSTLDGNIQSKTVRKVTIEIASFPDTVKTVFQEIYGYATGDYIDKEISVKREKSADYSKFVSIPSAPGINVDGLIMLAQPGKMANGWRLIAGAFTIDGEVVHAALLISPDLIIVRKWELNETAIGNLKPMPKHKKFLHGLELLDDGSIIFTFDGSISLQRVDVCGNQKWATGGKFHHAVTLDDKGESVWTFKSDNRIAQVSVEDGSILRVISISEVIAKNPRIDILEIRRLHQNDHLDNSRNTSGRWLKDRFHFNDVDPLPAALAGAYPDFKAGDLLVSSRSLNLLFVLDPDTLEIKWWRIGMTQRQHDPDWLANGTISVLNNRMSRDYSEIIRIDPKSFKRTTAFDGRKNNFYTRIRGKHQSLKSGTLIVTSPQQGRAFEVNKSGDVVFEIANLKPESNTINYVISEMKWFPRKHFDMSKWKCMPNN